MDGGSTIIYIAAQLVQSGGEDKTIITPNCFVIKCLCGKVRELRLVGGKLWPERSSTLEFPPCDFETQEITKSFVSLDGLSCDKGIYCAKEYVDTKRRVIAATKNQIVFVCNHSKIGCTSGHCFITFDELAEREKDFLVLTDNNLTNEGKQDQRRFEVEMVKLREKFPEGKFVSVSV